MNRFKSKNKICLQSNEIIFHNINLEKLKKKKWFFLKKKQQQVFESKKKNRIAYAYKQKLILKQKLKSFYGFIPEYQFKKIYFKSLEKNSNHFLIVLESRIDVLLYRLKIVRTIANAQQLIKKGLIDINNKTIFSSNFQLKAGDIITLNKKINNFQKNSKIPLNIELNYKTKKIIFLRTSYLEEISYPFTVDLKQINMLYN